MLVAAEASGDALGAALARAIRRRLGDGVRFIGVGGAGLAAEGVESPFDVGELSVLGFLEGVAAYPRVVKRADETAALAERERPDIAVLIDSWGFTLRVARRLRRRHPGLPIVKYVGPQVWASRPGRARTLAATVDRLLTIHSFDAPVFEAQGLPTTFVGNSAAANERPQADAARLRAHIGADGDDPILLVLPGSRPGEIERMLPPFAEAAGLVKADRPTLHVVVPAASSVAGRVRERVAGWPFRAHVVEDETLKADALRAGTVALACSGTVTTELAMAGCPMVVGYRLGALSYTIMKRVIVTPYVTLLNVAAGTMVVPEFLQDRCRPDLLAAAVAERLDDPALRARQVAQQDAALVKMGRGGPDPSERAADAVLEMLRERGAHLLSSRP